MWVIAHWNAIVVINIGAGIVTKCVCASRQVLEPSGQDLDDVRDIISWVTSPAAAARRQEVTDIWYM